MKKVSLIFSAVVMIAMMLSSYGEGASDREGASDDVTIGQQVWMSQNLNVDKFRNGDPIQEAKTDDEWEKAGENGQPAWCYYNNDPANAEFVKLPNGNAVGGDGKLYNWYAVNDPRGLAPKGWHIPTDVEWTILEEFLGKNAAKKIKSTSGWDADGDGNNHSGFSGIPSGVREEDGTFAGLGYLGAWWSSTVVDTDIAMPANNIVWYRFLDSWAERVGRNNHYKNNGLSVRCLRD